MGDGILVANNIYKSFGAVQALKGVSFEVSAGQVHCLVGENGSGKSTFVKVIAGAYAPDSGEIFLNGNRYSHCTVRDSIREGVQVIYQDFSLFPQMTVAENIALNAMVAENRHLVKWKEVRDIAREQLEKIDVDMDLEAPVESLSVANRQLIAICRAMSQEAKLLFMDEPTTTLTKKEVNRLILIVQELKKKGMSIVFISHKLNEVVEIADQVTVFRDGEKVAEVPGEEVNEEMLAYHMTGRVFQNRHYSRRQTDDVPLLEVNGLESKGKYRDISFRIRKGDIVGLIGLIGSGRTELALTLFGLNPQDRGTILRDGKPIRFTSPRQAIAEGISLLPENRQAQGCYLERSVCDNMSAAIVEKLKSRLGVLDRSKEATVAMNAVERLGIMTPDIGTEVRNLSGGNAQKVAIGKWIATEPSVMIMDSPTVGVDIGSKTEIYHYIQRLAEGGMGVLLISDEIAEIVANCNRVMVMQNGEIAAVLDEKDLKDEGVSERIFDLMNSPARRNDDERN